MPDEILDNVIFEIERRIFPEGGFADHIGGEYRPDATAWAVLAFKACKKDAHIIEQALSRFSDEQLDDGRVCISPKHPDAFWPTSLAILAWYGSTGHTGSQSRAVNFLLNNSGKHYERKPDSASAHDTSISGWPWIENTHSWVEPTALALVSLRASGHEKHPRAIEAKNMLMDRQLPVGGWNYGNTSVFGTELHSMPGPTGISLQALAALLPREQIENSLIYLKTTVEKLYTPFALGWSLLGLSAWNERPANSQALILSSLERQKRYGPYPTSLLSLLVLASVCENGLLNHECLVKGEM
jgi:hypothetical protein